MKKLVVALIWVSLMLVLSACSMESKYNSEGHEYAPDGVEEKH